MKEKYILNANGEPVIEPNLMKWAHWMEKNFLKRHAADEMVGTIRVSTIFLGLDDSFAPDGAPVLWETMVFGGRLHNAVARCTGTREQALAMHYDMVARVKAESAKDMPLIRQLHLP